MGPQTLPDTPKAAELLQIALGAVAGLAVGALAGAAVFQSVVVALLGALGGAVLGLIAALKRIEGYVDYADSLSRSFAHAKCGVRRHGYQGRGVVVTYSRHL
jgi:hypothetical protein